MQQEEQILRLQSLFRGNPRVIGQASADLRPDENDPTKLNQSRRGFAPGPATDIHWKHHLDGTNSLGLVPINDYQEVKFMAIDVDLDIMEGLRITLHSLCAQIEANGMPFIVCRSKSGAAHLYCFFKDDTAVAPVRNAMIRMADYMGMTTLERPCEFFPHTSKLDKESNGKYINLPYFNSNDTTRYGLSATGNRLSLSEFILLAESKCISSADFCKWKAPQSEDTYLRDIVCNGPPCLQTIYDQGIQDGTKNDILFQFGILFKRYNAKTFEDNTELVNQSRCETPHNSSDLTNTLKGLRKKTYHYNCAHPCMAPICAKSLCMSRKYGIKANVEFPPIKEIIQWGASDEYFEIVFETGAKVKVLASAMINFQEVQGVLIQALHVVLPTPKRADWNEFITGLMVKVKRMDVPKEFNVESSIQALIIAYATSRTIGTKLEDLLVKKPVRQDDKIYIRHKDIQEEILKRRFPGYLDGSEYAVVYSMGGTMTALDIAGQRFAVFIIPDPKINQEQLLEKVATDFQPQY